MAAAAPVPSAEILAVTFSSIPANKWADSANPECVRMTALRAELNAMQTLWQGVIDAVDPAATTVAYEALKADVHKIVNLTGITPANVVFPGGSRKKRQSKKKKNNKHNNKNNQ